MKLLKSVVLCAGLLGVMGSSAVYAADMKIGVIDVQQIMKTSSQAHTLNQQLQEKFKPVKEKLSQDAKNLQAEIADFTKNQAVMKNDDKTKLKNKIIENQQAYQALLQSTQKDWAATQTKDMKIFMDNLQNAVNTVAKKGQYTLILNRAAVPYMAEGTDVTSQVLDNMAK